MIGADLVLFRKPIPSMGTYTDGSTTKYYYNGAKLAAEKNTIHFVTIAQIETPIIPDPSPITAVTGTTTTKIISKHGDSTKPISVYANRDAENPVKSFAAGIKINISSFTLNLSLGFDNIGLYSSITDGNTTDSF